MGQEVEQSALVLVATAGVVDRLREVVAAGWSGPLVVVPTVADARELMGEPDGGAGAAERARVVLDPDRQSLAAPGGEVHLTPLEFGLLRALLEQPGRTLPFADLTDQVWGTRHLGDSAQVHGVVKRLRRKIEGIGSPLQVHTVHGVGLRVAAS